MKACRHRESAFDRRGRVCVLTGAGISAESGIPTFRGAGGLWRNFRPEDLATIRKRSIAILSWFGSGTTRAAASIAEAEPNPGHLRDRAASRCITQNVDELHQRAGSGTSWRSMAVSGRLRCTRCDFEKHDDARAIARDSRRVRVRRARRPGVVWFGEGLPIDVWDNACKAVSAATFCWSRELPPSSIRLRRSCRLRSCPGALVVEINPDETPISPSVYYSIRGTRRGSTAPTTRMKLCYIDAFSGISGDMTVGALLDAGADFTGLERSADVARHRRDVPV